MSYFHSSNSSIHSTSQNGLRLLSPSSGGYGGDDTLRQAFLKEIGRKDKQLSECTETISDLKSIILKFELEKEENLKVKLKFMKMTDSLESSNKEMVSLKEELKDAIIKLREENKFLLTDQNHKNLYISDLNEKLDKLEKQNITLNSDRMKLENDRLGHMVRHLTEENSQLRHGYINNYKSTDSQNFDDAHYFGDDNEYGGGDKKYKNKEINRLNKMNNYSNDGSNTSKKEQLLIDNYKESLVIIQDLNEYIKTLEDKIFVLDNQYNINEDIIESNNDKKIKNRDLNIRTKSNDSIITLETYSDLSKEYLIEYVIKLEEELQQMSVELSNINSKTDHKSQLELFIKKYNEANNEITLLKENNKILQDGLNQIKVVNIDNENDISGYKDELFELNSLIIEKTTQIELNNEEISKLKETINNNNSQIETLNDIIQKQEKDITNNKNEIIILEKNNNNQIEILNDNVQKKERDIKKIKDEMIQLENDKNTQIENYQEVLILLNKFKSIKKNIDERIAIVTSKLNEFMKYKNNFNDLISKELNNYKTIMFDTIKDCQNKIYKYNENINSKSTPPPPPPPPPPPKKLTDIDKIKSDLQNQLVLYQKEIKSLESKNELLEKMLSSLTTKNNKLSEDNTYLKTSNGQLAFEMSRMDKSLEIMTIQFTKANEELQNIKLTNSLK